MLLLLLLLFLPRAALQALSVEHDLDRARDRLCTRSDVQLTYLVTPVYDQLNLTQEHWQM